MSLRTLGGFITATYNPLAANYNPTSVSLLLDYVVVAGGGGGGDNVTAGSGNGGGGAGGFRTSIGSSQLSISAGTEYTITVGAGAVSYTHLTLPTKA